MVKNNNKNMITKFDNFINEGLLKDVKRFFNPSIDDIVPVLLEDDKELKNIYKRMMRYKDEDTFCEYIDKCEFILDKLCKLDKKIKNDEDKIKIEKVVKDMLNSIRVTFPLSLKAEVAPEWFINQLKNVIDTHEELADKYGVANIKITKFEKI